MCFQYNKERKEKKQAVKSDIRDNTGLKVGDRVKVTYSSYLNGEATFTGTAQQDGKTYYNIKTDDGRTGGFYREHLTLISTPVKTGFKIGDRVRVKVSRRSNYSLVPATVVGEARKVYSEIGRAIRIDDGTVIYFFDKNLEYLPVPAATSVTTKTLGSAYIAGANAAHRLAKQNGTVTADQVQAELALMGYTSRDLGNAAGSIFRSSKFRRVGEVNSTRPGNRGRKIAQWELVSA